MAHLRVVPGLSCRIEGHAHGREMSRKVWYLKMYSLDYYNYRSQASVTVSYDGSLMLKRKRPTCSEPSSWFLSCFCDDILVARMNCVF
jgi:hypothetical protein